MSSEALLAGPRRQGTLSLPEELWRHLKARAALEGTDMGGYAAPHLARALAEDSKPKDEPREE